MDRLSAPADVLEFIASKIQTNIRELEGALIRVPTYAVKSPSVLMGLSCPRHGWVRNGS